MPVGSVSCPSGLVRLIRPVAPAIGLKVKNPKAPAVTREA
jgi:hypothetical protein